MSTLTEPDLIAVMAYVDGELTAEDVVSFDARLALEPALANAVARERALRARLRSAYGPVIDEPVPAGLLDLLALPEAPPSVAANDTLPTGINDAARARLPHDRRWRWPTWGAMAASLMLGVLLGGRLLASHTNAGGDGVRALAVGDDGAITAQGALRDALEQRVAGTVLDPNSNVSVGLTFRNRAHDYCRTFSVDNASSGIACKQADGWVVATLEHAAVTPHAASAGGYRTAGSSFSPALLAAIDALRDGDTLGADDEAAARAKGWKR